jgi:phytanoyl-CoA dioxygenase PhyH
VIRIVWPIVRVAGFRSAAGETTDVVGSGSMTTSHSQRQFAPGALATRGFAVLRACVPGEAVDGALRHIHLDLVRRGLDADTIGTWLWSAHWFPHLKWDAPVAGLASFLPEPLRQGEQCDPQIVVQPPDDCDDMPLTSHVDRVPDWAEGRPYARIVGVALSPAHAGNGGLWVWPFDGNGPVPLELDPGDAVVMHPRLPHSSGLNREGALRYALYFRFLEDA